MKLNGKRNVEGRENKRSLLLKFLSGREPSSFHFICKQISLLSRLVISLDLTSNKQLILDASKSWQKTHTFFIFVFAKENCAFVEVLSAKPGDQLRS